MWFPQVKAQNSGLGQSTQSAKRRLWHLIQCIITPCLTFCTGWLFNCTLTTNQSLHILRIHYASAVMCLISIGLQLHDGKAQLCGVAAQEFSVKLVYLRETYKCTLKTPLCCVAAIYLLSHNGPDGTKPILCCRLRPNVKSHNDQQWHHWQPIITQLNISLDIKVKSFAALLPSNGLVQTMSWCLSWWQASFIFKVC